MKLIILMIAYSMGANAAIFYPVGKEGANTNYVKQVKCEEIEEQQCFDISTKNPNYHDLVTSQVDDLTKPIMKAPYNSKSCDDNELNGDCETKIGAEDANYCLAGDYIVTEKNAVLPGYTYFCMGIESYEQKTETILVENATNKTNYLAVEAIKAAEISAREMVYKHMAFGKKMVALISIRNSAKGLTSAQVKTVVETYSVVSDLLNAGAIITAKEEINTIVPDGVVMLQADKDALISEINSYLGL